MRSATLLLILVISVTSCSGLGASSLNVILEEFSAIESCTIEFKILITPPESSSLKLNGQAVWFRPDLFMTQYEASGGETVRGFRLGEEAWVYHELAEDWVTAREAGRSWIGRDWKNPMFVASIIRHQLLEVSVTGVRSSEGRSTYTISATGLIKLFESLKRDNLIPEVVKYDTMKGQFTLVAEERSQTLVGINCEVSFDLTQDDKTARFRLDAACKLNALNCSKRMRFTQIDPRTRTEQEIKLSSDLESLIASYFRRR